MEAHATLLLNDSFLDGDRTTQNLPNSAAWYTGGPGTNVSVNSNTGITFADASAGKATAMSYFTPTNLNVGDALTLTFNYSFTQTATADNSFMFGLYNSGGSFATKDSVGFNNSIFNSYTGYATSGVFGVDPSGPGRDHIEARDQLGHNLLSIGTYSEGSEYIQSGAATPGEIYTASMKISRTAAGITVQSQVGNTVMQQNYTQSMFTTFDSVGVFSNGNTGSFAIDGVKLEYIGAPEPSSFLTVALFGMMLVGNVAYGRMSMVRI